MEAKTRFQLVAEKMGALKKWWSKDSRNLIVKGGKREGGRGRDNLFLFTFRLGKLCKLNCN